jgi:hypothetical protein
VFKVESPDKQIGVDKPIPWLPVAVAGHDNRCGKVSERTCLVKRPGDIAGIEQPLRYFGQPLVKTRLSLFSPSGVGRSWLRVMQVSKD